RPVHVRSPSKPSNGDSNGSEVTHDRAETLRSRRLLISGIERVRARTLDAHGFRRLQDLVKQGNPDIWLTDAPSASSDNPSSNGNDGGSSAGKFADLLLALLAYLSVPLDPAKFPASKAQNLKTQALATLRAMLTLWRKESERLAAQVL